MREFKDSITGKDDARAGGAARLLRRARRQGRQPADEAAPRRLAYGEEATLVEHLGELRARIVVSMAAVIACFAVTYAFRGHILNWLNAPLPEHLKKPVTFGVAEPFITSVWVASGRGYCSRCRS